MAMGKGIILLLPIRFKWEERISKADRACGLGKQTDLKSHVTFFTKSMKKEKVHISTGGLPKVVILSNVRSAVT